MQRLTGLMTFFYCFMASGLVADEIENGPPRDNGLWQTLIMVAIAILFFYFILWKPEQKRRKETEEKRDSMKKGDRVTAMGIVGTVSKIQEHTVIVKMVDGSKIEFIKAAITDVVPATEQESAKDSAERD